MTPIAWLELHQAVAQHRKTQALADALQVAVPHALGLIATIWLWALDSAPDGRLDTSQAALARVAGWNGDGGAFTQALVDAGFLDEDGGALSLHDWADYAGRLVDARRADAARKRAERAARKGSPDASAGHPEDVRRTSVATVQYPTVPKGKGNARAREADAEAAMTQREQEAFAILRRCPGWRHDAEADLRLAEGLRHDYPLVDLAKVARDLEAHYSATPPKPKDNPRLKFRNWVGAEAAHARARTAAINGRDQSGRPHLRDASALDYVRTADGLTLN